MIGLHPEQEMHIEAEVGLNVISNATKILTDWETGAVNTEVTAQALSPLFIGQEKLLISFIELTGANAAQKRALKQALSLR